MADKIKWRFSPSYIENYYAKNKCERGLLIASTKTSDREKIGWETDLIRPSYVAKAGNEWEGEVLSIIGASDVMLETKKDAAGKLLDFDEEETKALYHKLSEDAQSEGRQSRYFYQTMLSVNNEFIRKHLPFLLEEYANKYNGIVGKNAGKYFYDDDKLTIEFSNSKPDLIKAEWMDDGYFRVRVIDIKLAKRPKLEHKMQIALYVLMLKEKLTEWGVDSNYVRLDMDYACLWNKGQTVEKPFELANPFLFLKPFLSEDIRKVYDDIHSCEKLEDILPSLDYSMGQMCEWCESFSYCKKWCMQNEPLALAPYITPNALKYLKDLKTRKPDIMTLDGFREFIELPENVDRLNQSIYWKRFIDYIKVINISEEAAEAENAEDADVTEAENAEAENAEDVNATELDDTENTNACDVFNSTSLDMLSTGIEAYGDSSQMKGILGQRKTFSIDLPNYEDTTIFFTTQKDEGSSRNYVYGIRIGIRKEHEEILKLSAYEDMISAISENICIKSSYNLTEGIIDNPNPYFSNGEIQIVAKNTDCFDELDQLFINLVHGYLKNISDLNWRINEYNIEAANRGEEKKRLVSVQGYVLENHEIMSIQEMLFNQFENTAIDLECKKKVCELLFWIQGQSLVEAEMDYRPETVMRFPIIVLGNVANRLYALPSLVGNNYYNFVAGFNPLGLHVGLENGPRGTSRFLNKVSNVFRNDVINQYWKDKNENDIDSLTGWIKSVLNSEAVILSSIRKNHDYINEVKNNSPVYAPAFFLQLQSDNAPADLFGKLLFEAKYEAALSKIGISSVRAMDPQKAAEEGKILLTRVISIDEIVDRYRNLKFEVKFEIINGDKVFRDDFFTLVFTKTNNRNLSILRGMNDPQRIRPYIDCHVYQGDKDVLFVTSPDRFETHNGNRYLLVTFSSGNRECPVEQGEEYWAYEYYKEYNLDKIENANASLASDFANERKTLATCMADISEYYGETGDSFEQDENELLSLGNIGGYTFSSSQKIALKQVYEKNITLLLGPPGTGKTDFISRTVFVLTQLFRSRGNNLRILICANSHSAIENVLFAISEKVISARKRLVTVGDNLNINKTNNGDLLVAKLERFDDGNSPSTEWNSGYIKNRPSSKGVIAVNSVKIKGILYDDMETLMVDDNFGSPLVVGATCWSLQKTEDYVKNFDVVIIDEASQVRMTDAVIPFSYGKEDARYLIVGDENQLSPIIMGKYDKNPEKPFIYGSVFRYMYDCSELNMSYYGNKYDNPNTLDYCPMLCENYRMNDVLVEYAANVIYGPEYKAPNEVIASQILSYSIPVEDYLNSINISESKKEIMEYILDPEHPLILCVVDNENISEILESERQWIRLLTRVLENTIACDQNNERAGIYDNPVNFWGNSSVEGAFGIIAPHHEHISRIKDILSDEDTDGITAPWGTEKREELYIGTVDKLQGKQRQAIIVSYGVSNIENALLEGEFIFSRNRLNVSLTRGKKKTIVFLTNALIEYPLEALAYDDQELLDGIQYITGFKKYMQEHESRVFEDRENGGNITIFRA